MTEQIRGPLAMRAELAINSVAPDRTELARYESIELTVDLSASYDNPYDRRELGLDGRFEHESGEATTVPGFYYIAYEPETPGTTLAGNAPYSRVGDPCWKIRFTPRKAGAYRCSVTARDRSGGTVTADPLQFTVLPRNARGSVRVARANRRYFEFEDGSLFFPIGANVAWTHEYYRGKPYATYEHYFNKLAEAGGNATRVWICHWSWLEWTPREVGGSGTLSDYAGAGFYNQKVACAFDRIFALAEKLGLQVCLCTDDNNEHIEASESYDSWECNPYNANNGGPCPTASDFWVNSEARRLYKQRLSYINARWGHSPSLWCWNFWNDCSSADPGVVAWLSEMYGHLKVIQTNFPDRPVGTNFGHSGGEFHNDIMDYVNGGGGPVYFERVARFGDYWQRKPFIQLEVPYDPDPEWFLPGVHEGFWRAVGLGLAGAMYWSWELFEQCGWGEFRPTLDFVGPLPLSRHQTQSLELTLRDVQLDQPGKPFVVPVALRPVYRWGRKAPCEEFHVTPGGCRQEVDLHALLYGHNREAWRTAPTFDVDSPHGGTLVIDVAEIGAGTQVLQLKLDGQVVLERSLPDGRRVVRDPEEKYAKLPLPPGPHTLVASNEGGDWISVARYEFLFQVNDPDVFPPVEAIGQCGPDFALMWLHNIYDAKTAKRLHLEARVVREATVEMVGPFEPGAYRVEWWDTNAGSVVKRERVAVEGERISVSLPQPLTSDIACRLLRQLEP
jgi:hypothetical protein